MSGSCWQSLQLDGDCAAGAEEELDAGLVDDGVVDEGAPLRGGELADWLARKLVVGGQ